MCKQCGQSRLNFCHRSPVGKSRVANSGHPTLNCGEIKGSKGITYRETKGREITYFT